MTKKQQMLLELKRKQIRDNERLKDPNVKWLLNHPNEWTFRNQSGVKICPKEENKV